MSPSQRRFTRDRTHEGHYTQVPAKEISPRLTKDEVEAHAETTILCAFGLCTLSPKSLPRERHASMMKLFSTKYL